jgi:peroxiredoxin
MAWRAMGLHCPICFKYLIELARLVPEFERRGVNVIALSSDGRERAQAMADKLNAPALRIGFGLPMVVARQWGLYLSTSRGTTSIGIEEPPLFSEPAVYLVRPNGTLYYGSVQTMPFARPHFDELLTAIDFAVAKDYPARGEYSGPRSRLVTARMRRDTQSAARHRESSRSAHPSA